MFFLFSFRVFVFVLILSKPPSILNACFSLIFNLATCFSSTIVGAVSSLSSTMVSTMGSVFGKESSIGSSTDINIISRSNR